MMACAVRAMDTKDADETFLGSLAKIATSEIITSKVILSDSALCCIPFFRFSLCVSYFN